jgi:N6-adenosine-specific RNA methylase IME4
MPGWLTLGNQLTDVRLKDKAIIKRYQNAYPKQDVSE